LSCRRLARNFLQ